MRGALLSTLMAGLLAACSSPAALPLITDAPQLVKDSQALAITTPAGHQIPPDRWPTSIKTLNPVFVSREADGLHITTYAETGEGARGYVIAPTAPPDNDHFTFSPTPYPQIYRFDFKP